MWQGGVIWEGPVAIRSSCGVPGLKCVEVRGVRCCLVGRATGDNRGFAFVNYHLR
jgi:hypothetical protein